MKRVRLSRKITLEKPRAVPDGAGGFAQSWDALGILWADVKALSSSNAVLSDTQAFEGIWQFVIRNAPHGSERRPQRQQRFAMGARRFRITSVTEHDPRGRYLRCLAQEEVSS